MEERRLCEKQPCRAFLEFLLNLSSVTTTKWQLFFCLFNCSWFICGFNIQYWILFNPRNNSLPNEVSNSVQNRSYSKGGTYYFSVLLLILRFKANINSEISVLNHYPSFLCLQMIQLVIIRFISFDPFGCVKYFASFF